MRGIYLFLQDSHSPAASKRLENGDSSPLPSDAAEKKAKKENSRDPRDARDPRDLRDPRDPRDIRDPRDPREQVPTAASSPPVPSVKHGKVRIDNI